MGHRKRLIVYGGVAALLVAWVVAIAVVAAGGDDEGDSDASGAGATEVFPAGGEVGPQQHSNLPAAAEAAGCELKDSEGGGTATHTPSLDEKVAYPTNPPTNGRHYEVPAEDGLYQEAPADEALVHSLEHGRVIVWVQPTIARDARATVRALFDEDEYQMVVVPRREMAFAAAATAWNRDPTPGGTGRTLGCERWNDAVVDALRGFRDVHRSNGPEPIP